MRRGDDPRRKREQDGRYAVEQPCDACGKPIHGEHCTDDEVCEGSDRPGFLLCARKRCVAVYENMTVAERRAFYRRRCAGPKRLAVQP